MLFDMAGNPSWFGMHINESGLISSSSLSSSSSSSVYGSSTATSDTVYGFDHLPVRSWSQLLLGGGGGFQQEKKMEIWDNQVMNLSPFTRVPIIDVKQELVQSSRQQIFENDEFPVNRPWQQLPASSPSSFITNSLLSEKAVAVDGGVKKNHKQSKTKDHSLEKCKHTSIVVNGASKKARVQPMLSQPALKVRKEKLGDRITALHQLVSPFGKTDTASVLAEAIGYIRFLQTQVEALSSPYVRTQNLDSDLRSRGLCLVPISCTHHIGNDTGADYWAPSSLGGGF